MSKENFLDMFSRFFGIKPIDNTEPPAPPKSAKKDENSSSLPDTSDETTEASAIETLFSRPILIAGDIAMLDFAHATQTLFEETLPRWTVRTHICPVIVDKRTSFDTWQKTQISYSEEKEENITQKTNIKNKNKVLEFVGEAAAKINLDIKAFHTIHGIGAFSTERKTTIKLHRIPVFEIEYKNKNFKCTIEPTFAKVDPKSHEVEVAYSIPNKFWRFRQPKRNKR